jgi:DNA-binding LytR/AlgR family response regulator
MNKLIDNYAFRENVNISISVYQNPDELIKHHEMFDVIFLDIQFGMKKIGFQVGVNLRELGCNAEIIFLTMSFTRLCTINPVRPLVLVGAPACA